jgi:hypothetical protein
MAGPFARDVPEAYLQWRSTNADAPTERFIGRVYAEPFAYELEEAHFPYQTAYNPQLQLPEPTDPCRETWWLRWSAMVEYLHLRLAWPLEPIRWGSELRYKPLLLRPPRSPAQIAAMDDCLRRYDVTGIVTTNYDVLAEQLLGVRPSVASPGFNYGRIDCVYRPPNSPFPRERTEYSEPVGAIRVSKLHGSLNWSLNDDAQLDVYCDLRPAFRGGGTAAIIPPLPEKQVPPWLEPVWQEALETLSRADAWIVIGYSLPDYDFEVRHLLSAAYQGQAIEIWDPSAQRVADAFTGVAPGASFDLRSGLTSDQPNPFARRKRQRRPRLGGADGFGTGRAIPQRPSPFIARPNERRDLAR